MRQQASHKLAGVNISSCHHSEMQACYVPSPSMNADPSCLPNQDDVNVIPTAALAMCHNPAFAHPRPTCQREQIEIVCM